MKKNDKKTKVPFFHRISLLEKFTNFSLSDYVAFFEMPFKQRLQAASAFALFFLSVITIIHLAFYNNVKNNETARLYLILFYSSIYVGMILQTVLPILFKALRNFLPLLTVTSFIISLAGGFLFSFSIRGDAGIELNHLNVIVWLIGLFAIVFGVKLLTKVLRSFFIAKTTIDTEIGLAKEMQQKLLPDQKYENDYININARTIAANEVGGDYFDFASIKDGKKLLVAIGDVAGHNVAAGLLMGMVKSAFQTEIKYFESAPKLVDSLNKTVLGFGNKSHFVSFQLLEFDFESQKVQMVNAGHVPVLILRENGEVETIQLKKAPALGLSERSVYKSEEYNLCNGDIFILSTDGIFEAGVEEAREIGIEGVCDIIRNIGNTDPDTLSDTLFQNIEKINGGKQGNDDMTLFILQVKSEGST